MKGASAVLVSDLGSLWVWVQVFRSGTRPRPGEAFVARGTGVSCSSALKG